MFESYLKIKKPWIAGLLNIILPGLGFVYLMGVFSVIGGIMVMIFTFYLNASPVFWIVYGAGIPDISSWIFWGIIICAVSSVHITRWRNKKIGGKTSGMTQASSQKNVSQPVVDSVTYCPKCGTEVKSRYVFCAKCGEPVKNSSPQNDTTPKKCSSCGFEIQSGDVFCENCGNKIV